METVLDTYQDDFKELVDTVEVAYQGNPLHFSKPHLKALYSSLTDNRSGPTIDREDIEQQLALLWLKYAKGYHESKPSIHLRQYLIRRSVWGLRDWFNMEMKPIPYYLLLLPPQEEYLPKPFKLDLGFLLYGTRFYPLSILSSYERYLIFLMFKEERTILEIAKAVQKSDKTVSKQLRNIINKLRSECNASKKSS